MALLKIIENAVLFLEDGEASQAERALATDTQEKSVVSSMCKKLDALPKNLNTSNRPTIFRVPANLRKNKENLIEPSVVSIGPYHRDHKQLKPMEEIKWFLLKDILPSGNNMVTMMKIVEKIKSVQLQARSCYSECVEMDDDSFIEMLILDSTFIIQFMKHFLEWFKEKTGWASACIATDLILLENQIPFFMVEILWDIYFGSKIKIEDLNTFTERLCSSEILVHFTKTPEKINHLLHLCHLCVVPDMSRYKAVQPGCTELEFCAVLSCNGFLSCTISEYQELSEIIIPCATALNEAGIKFRKKRSKCKMMDVNLQGSTLEIPFILIDDNIKPLLLNLLALEQSDFLSKHLTSYLFFMDYLINTYHDVAILQKEGIIGNMLSGEEEVAQFFNQLCDGAVNSRKHYLSDLFKEVNQHYNLKCRRYRAKLMRKYFNSPWSIISVLAAFILLVLTFVQTYFACYAYFYPS